jgi:3-phenylpropionate/trans-cinnamate dioxygenase ferredoxin reductase subunit
LIDPKRRQVLLQDGEILSYDYLVIATGANPRLAPIEGADLPEVHRLRSARDAEKLRDRLQTAPRLAIIGGGYVGLEVAAATITLGGKAVVFEQQGRLLARVASPELSNYFEQLHREHGVQIVTGAQVRRLVSLDGASVQALELADGRAFDCDAALMGVGAEPCQDLASAAGLRCEGGIAVDMQARTSDPFIFAVGDATARPIDLLGGSLGRLESVPNASEQARQAVCAILDLQSPPPEVPWFWSDQFDTKLQIAGISAAADETIVRAESEKSFAVFHLAQGQLVCVEAVNAAGSFVAGKRLIEQRARLSAFDIRNMSLSMKDLIAKATPIEEPA